jgi:alkanesulfonate monooxygenase SsuD/methylene tetrahydromethanopterin reductase-like flavin-dependent oxidoreductase (luciferase family)
MKFYHFTEMPYPYLPPFDEFDSMWVSIPNRIFDPKIGADLYNRYLDEYVIADELGLNHMVNEHHQTATCINSTVPLTAAIIARQTKRGRICVLGNPVANRGEPIRIAEEMAMIDCISRGRLDCGFVRGVPYENYSANSNPTKTVERLWEGVDVIVKAWTTHDGPFSYEGAITHRRAINIWPRPYQSPHPPIWITGSSDFEAIRKVANRGFTFATFLQPHDVVRGLFDAYRAGYRDSGVPGSGGMAFMPLVYTADSEADAEAGARELTWYLKAKVAPQHRDAPGYLPSALAVKVLQGAYSGRTVAIRAATLEYQKEQGVIMYGTPDSVAAQINRFYERVGGFDHLLMMQQAGFLDHKRTVRSMTLFAQDVMPQVCDLPGIGATVSATAAE